MSIKNVLSMSKATAAKCLPVPGRAFISIVEPKEERPSFEGWEHVLRLTFHDTDAHANGGQTWAVNPLPEGNYTSFSIAHADEIIKFLDNLPDDIVEVFVHCHAGISRSTAVARFIADKYYLKNFDYRYSLYNRRVYSMLRDINSTTAYTDYDS